MGCEQLHQNPKEDGGKQPFVSVASEELPENLQFHPLYRSLSLIWHMMPNCLTKEGLQIKKIKRRKIEEETPGEGERTECLEGRGAKEEGNENSNEKAKAGRVVSCYIGHATKSDENDGED